MSVYNHRIYCITSGGWAYKLKEDEVLLTTCPDDPAHSVQAGSASIVETRAPSTVVIDREPGSKTYGNIRVDSLAVSAPAGGNGTVDISWPYDISIYTLRAVVTADCVGCFLTLDAGPRTTVGTLTADAPIGAAVLNVSPTVVANVTPGVIVTLQQGASSQELGAAIAIDPAGTLTVATPTTIPFSAAGPTLVQATKRAANQMELSMVGVLTFGEDRSKAVQLQKGRILRYTLQNPNPAPARLVLYVSYNY